MIAARVIASSDESSRCAGSWDPPAAIAIIARSKRAHPQNLRFIRGLTVGPKLFVLEGKPQLSHIRTSNRNCVGCLPRTMTPETRILLSGVISHPGMAVNGELLHRCQI